MDQKQIGEFIAKKRKEHQLTQEQLSLKLSVSNKSISKWETGKCMPDYSIQKELCNILEISISELLEGKESESSQPQDYNNKILDLLLHNEQMKYQKNLCIGLLLLVIGRIPSPISSNHTPSGDFIEGFGIGISIGITLLGIVISVYNFVKLNRIKKRI